ncbi:MAG: hypothetical protein J6Y56_02125 [Fibrobacterales bacterium]|nr:hypothetical protein [Fibrobacterales bacterium]
MRKTVECAVAVLAAVTAVWGGARESVPSFAESAEEAKIDEELEKLKKLDRESPFPCWYADVKRAPFDSVWEIPTFLNADGSIQPCYPCAPRIVLSRFVSFDRDEDPAEFWKGDTNRLFGAFLHPMRKRSPSALSAPTFSDMEDWRRREAEIGRAMASHSSRRGMGAGDTLLPTIKLARNGTWREVKDPADLCRSLWGGRKCVPLTPRHAAVQAVLSNWSFPDYLTDARLEFHYLEAGNPGVEHLVVVWVEFQRHQEPEYCQQRSEMSHALFHKKLRIRAGQ